MQQIKNNSRLIKIALSFILISHFEIVHENVHHVKPLYNANKIKIELEQTEYNSVIKQIENANNKNVNPYGNCFGNYQLHILMIRHFNFKGSIKSFISDDIVQDTIMNRYTNHHKLILSSYINSFSGKTIKGNKLNKELILAGAHLSGAGNMVKYLKSNGNIESNDGFINITQYISKYARISLSIKRNRK